MGMMMIVVWCQHQVVMVEIVAASQVNARKVRGTVIQPVTVMETLCVALTTAKLDFQETGAHLRILMTVVWCQTQGVMVEMIVARMVIVVKVRVTVTLTVTAMDP